MLVVVLKSGGALGLCCIAMHSDAPRKHLSYLGIIYTCMITWLPGKNLGFLGSSLSYSCPVSPCTFLLCGEGKNMQECLTANKFWLKFTKGQLNGVHEEQNGSSHSNCVTVLPYNVSWSELEKSRCMRFFINKFFSSITR